MIRTGLALMLNWLACTAVVLLFGRVDLWAWFTLFDTVAAVVVTVRPAARVQAAIGAVLIAQIMCHAVYAIALYSKSSANLVAYVDMLDRLAAVNLLLFGGWVGGRGVRWCVDRLPFRRADPVAVSARLAGMD